VASLRNSNFQRKFLPLKGAEDAKKGKSKKDQITIIENFRLFLGRLLQLFCYKRRAPA
jgi:hypothetical protein